MTKLKFLFLCVIALFLSNFNLSAQKQICSCKMNKNYNYKSEYDDRWKNRMFDINDYLDDIESGKTVFTSKDYQEAIFNNIRKSLSELIPPYSISYETQFTNYLPPNWVQEDAGFHDNLTLKKPFNTYIDENKNFDIMFCLRDIKDGKKQIIMVVKNYYTNSEYKSLGDPTFVIDDQEFSFSASLNSLGSKYKDQLLAIKSGVNVVAYRNVVLHLLDFYAYALAKDQDQFVSTLISKIKPNKVFITYETSTGQIKRTLTETQVKSLKEMLQIYEKFQFDKWDITYLNEQVKKDCQEMEAKIQQANEPHYTALQPIIDRINEVMEKYKKF